jgi:5-methylcytosine-specific restriction protein B
MGAATYFKSQPAISDVLKTNIHRLQLHPAYSYEDFIGGLHIIDGSTRYRPGYLPRLLKSMSSQELLPDLPHVLVLDEINRADLSRMLGECFSLLEDRNQIIELTAQDEHSEPVRLQVPDNLFIIGTMNLIDQSIEQVDFALRRRFFWKECPFDSEALLATCEALWQETDIGIDWARVEPDFWRLGEAASALNAEIRASALLGRQYEIGHTYFFDVVRFLEEDVSIRARSRSSFLWRNGEALRPVQALWRLSLWPLLHSYLSGLEETARDAELSRLEQVFLSPQGE